MRQGLSLVCSILLVGSAGFTTELSRVTFTVDPDDPSIIPWDYRILLDDETTDEFDIGYDAVAPPWSPGPDVRILTHGVPPYELPLYVDARPGDELVDVSAYWSPADGDGIREEVWGLGAVDPSYPDTVTINAASDGIGYGPVSGTLTWDLSETADSSFYLYDVDADTEIALQPGGSYEWDVDEVGQGPFLVISCAYSPGPPPPPAYVTASDGVFLDKVLISWSFVDFGCFYEVWREDPDGSRHDVEITYNTFAYDATVQPGVHYWYDVWSVDPELGCSLSPSSDEGWAAVPADIYVDVSNNTGVEDGSPAHPYNTIQEGIDAAENWDTVIVAPGEYVENISLVGSGIVVEFTLRSVDPEDPAVVASTIINGDADANPATADGPAVTFSGSEDGTCTLSGFTIRNGYATLCGGGIAGNGTHARVENCVIESNRADFGGGLWECYGNVVGNIIADNSAVHHGGGIYGGGSVIGNTIEGNTAEQGHAGGLYQPGTLIADNSIIANTAYLCGGAIYGRGDDDRVRIVNSLIAGNVAITDSGGGIYNVENATLRNCTIANNYANDWYGGIGSFNWLENCIIAHNTAPTNPNVDPDAQPTYCCIPGWASGGVGNISDPPLFITQGYWTGVPGESEWVHGDYRLSQIAAGQVEDSPCLDAGDPTSENYGTTRTDGLPDEHPVDMGYHFPGDDVAECPVGWLQAGWNLISLPLLPSCSCPEAALPGVVSAGNELTNSLYRYIPGSGYEIYRSGFADVGIAKAYWLYLQHTCENATSGLTLEGDVEVELANGWNMIGSPKPSPVLLASCWLSDGVEQKTYEDAVSAGWIQEVAYCYESGAGYGTVSPAGAEDDYLRPWYGYWLLAYVDGLTLVVP